jgi:aspartate aminotransferase
MTPLSTRARSVQPSLTLVISAKAKQMKAEGLPILDFSVGEPDFDTPEPVQEAAVEAMRSGYTRYTAGGGAPDLKDAIAAKYEAELGIRYGHGEILVSNGGKHAIHNLFQAMLDPGDEVIVPSPYWVSYPDMVRLSDGVPVVVDTDPATGYRLKAEALERAITPRTRILVLNSPSNPTGAVYGEEDMRSVAAVVEKAGITVVSDDVYEKFVYDGRRFVSLLSVAPHLRGQVFIVNSASKTYAMPGWRMGYALGPEEAIRAATRIQGQATSCPGSIAQKALVCALGMDPAVVDHFRRSFESRRNRMMEGLSAIEGIRPFRPEGAFYVFADVSGCYGRNGLPEGSVAFCEDLLRRLHIACIPGAAFGDDRCIRFSFVTGESIIEEGIDKLADL